MNPYDTLTDALKANNVKYEELDHDPVYTADEAAKVKGLSLEAGAKSLLLKTKDRYILVVLAGSRKLDSKKLKMTVGIKEIRFATPAEVKDKMGCIIGACYPFGSIVGLETFIDKSLLNQPKISFSPGVHHKSIKVKLSDYLKVEKPQIVDVSAL